MLNDVHANDDIIPCFSSSIKASGKFKWKGLPGKVLRKINPLNYIQIQLKIKANVTANEPMSDVWIGGGFHSPGAF